MSKIDYSLYLVTDTAVCYPRSLLETVAAASDHGITCVQLRMKNATTTTLTQTGKQLLEILNPKQIPLIINDNIEVAKTINAAGVHIGQTDIAYQQAREYLGPDKIIGLSIENYQQAILYQNCDVDYFGIGPIYHTATKPDAAPPIGIAALKNIAATLAPKPTVAIGSINANTIDEVLKTHINGVAVISAILASPSPALATQKLAQIIAQHRAAYA